MKLGDNLGDTKIRGTEKPVLSLFFICNAFLLSASSGFDSRRERKERGAYGLLFLISQFYVINS